MEPKISPITQSEVEGINGIVISNPTPDQWSLYRDLKLRSIDQEPIAFLDPEEGRARWQERSEKEWREILSGPKSDGSETVVVMAMDGEKAIGMVQAVVPAARPEGKNPAHLEHMYVESEGYRGKGFGRNLLETLIARLKERGTVDKAVLDVVMTQTAAINLYRSLGFIPHKYTTDSAKRGDETFDEMEMILYFH